MNSDSTKRRWLFLLAASALGLLAIAALLYLRIARCIVYNKLISVGSASKNLAPQPRNVTISFSENTAPISLGYADTALPENWATTTTFKVGAVVVEASVDQAVIFMQPFFDSHFSRDGDYSWAIATTQAKQVSMWEMFTMSSSECEKLIYYALPKSMNSFNQNGIGHFETEHVRGIIRYGQLGRPGDVDIQVWSKHGRISQGILVRASDAHAASQIVHCVLSNLRYSIENLPSEGALHELIQRTLESHELFSPNPDSA